MFNGLRIDRFLDKVHVLLEAKKSEEALEILEKAEKIDENDPYIAMFKGIAYFQLKEFDKAEEYLLKPSKELKVDAIPEIFLGRIELERDNPEKAVTFFDSAIKKDKLHPDAHYYAGLSYIKMNKLDKATNHFETLIAEKREFVWARILTLLEKMNLSK